MPRKPTSYAHLSQEEIKDLETKTANYQEAAREPSTNKNRNHHQRLYTELCVARGKSPWPADTRDVAVFLVAECERLESVQSVDQMQSSIRTHNREVYGDEWTKPQLACLAMAKRGLRKRFRQPTRRKRPITLNILADLVRGLDMENTMNLQYSTMMFVAHDACLRTKELLALRWSDITWVTDAAGEPTAMRIKLRVSKARYTEAAETLEVGGYTLGGIPVCGLQLLWFYMHDEAIMARTGGDQESFLFPNVRTGSGEVPRNSFITWVQSRLHKCGYKATEFAGHSFRAGGCTDMHEGNAPEQVARMLGRWRSRESYLIYIRLHPSKRAADVSQAFSSAYASAVYEDATAFLTDAQAARFTDAYDREFKESG